MPFVLLGGLSSGFFPPPPGGGFFPPPPAPVFLPPLPLPPREILALGILGGRVLGGASRAGRRVAGSLAARPAAGARQGPWRRWRCGGQAGAAGGAEGGGVGREEGCCCCCCCWGEVLALYLAGATTGSSSGGRGRGRPVWPESRSQMSKVKSQLRLNSRPKKQSCQLVIFPKNKKK